MNEEENRVAVTTKKEDARLSHDKNDCENWDDAIAWAEVADEFYHCSAKNESIIKLGKKYILVKRQ